MNYLSAESVSKNFGDKVLFDDISFGIDQGEKVALVGINGSGKSTLLKMIMGKEPPNEGEITFRNDIAVAFLEQNPTFNEADTVMESIFNTENEALSVIKEYEFHLLHAATSPVSQQKLANLISKMDSLNAWDYESQIKQILGKLGVHDLEQKINELSGGQRKRVALAKILINKPDFLILDEPTNHLDLDTIEWLENYLATANMSLLLVTHDRYFLEKVTNVILELENENIYRYKGNYSYFLEKKAEREEQQATEVGKAKNLLKKELEWMRRQPRARGTKAKYRVDAFHDLQDKASKKLNRDELELSIQATRQGGKILELENISKAFGPKQVVDDFSYIFKKKDRIGIIGPNGAGKSTFLNMITGKLSPDEGEVIKGQTTVFGYYTQEELTFKQDQRVIDIVKEIAEVVKMSDGREISASQFLQHFQFPPKMQYNVVSKLSGGEKRRLQLLRVLIKNPNFLILDEPTNDLDLITLNILEDFLLNFGGCLLLVSHDRYFMDRLVDHIFIFEGEGSIKDFPGNYTDFRDFLKEQAPNESESDPAAKTDKKEENKPETPRKKLSFKEKREYEQLQNEIERLEQQKQALIEKLNAGSNDHEALTGWSLEIEKLDQQIEKRSDRWLELSEFAD